MRKLCDLIKDLSQLNPEYLEALSAGLVGYNGAVAERLKNSITFAQQEEDMMYMAQIDQRNRACALEDFDRVSER